MARLKIVALADAISANVLARRILRPMTEPF
jgi:hypothetical protein